MGRVMREEHGRHCVSWPKRINEKQLFIVAVIEWFSLVVAIATMEVLVKVKVV